LNFPGVPFLGVVDVPVPAHTVNNWRLPAVLQDSIVILGIGLGLLVVLVLWAVFIRKPRHRTDDSHSSRRVIKESQTTEESGNPRRHRHRQRRRRREHRSRNPTLAETGGLPPLRPDDQSPPPVR
jgi:hypothetical protein